MSFTNAQDEDDDVVVEEIPVFLSNTLKDNLYVFQYPTKTQISNFDNVAVVNCCVKPINQEVKVDFALNSESHFYDRFKGEQFATAADGAKSTHAANSKGSGERPTYKRGIMDKQSFVSMRSLENVERYIVGVYADKELHLSPLTSIVQLRPSFSHFDKEDKRNKAEQKALNEEDEEEELQQVTVKFARSSANMPGAANKKTKEKPGYESYLKKRTDEPWCETYWHSRTSPTSELERHKLFATDRRSSDALALETHKYAQKLMPCDGSEQGIDAVLPARVISKARLKSMTLPEQLKVILKDAKMLNFEEIKSLVQAQDSLKVTTDSLLQSLNEVGLLIHGNWVVQSEILYPPETLSDSNGINAETMIRARDYVIFRFSRSSYLYRRQVIAATQLPPAEALEVLCSVACLNSEKNWQLLLPPDREFEQRYPDLVKRQELLWISSEQTYNDMDSERSPKRTRKRSLRDSKGNQYSMSTADIAAATNIMPTTSAAASSAL